jgi:hypothetical protein
MPQILFLVTTPEGSLVTISDTPENAVAKVATHRGVDGAAFKVRPIAKLEAVE